MSEREMIINDYMHAHRGKSWEKDRLDFIESFLDNDKDYEPTDQAIQNAFCDFILRPNQWSGWSFSRAELVARGKSSILAGLIKNLSISLRYGFSSTLGGNASIVEISADVAGKRMTSGGVAFSLEDFVQKKV